MIDFVHANWLLFAVLLVIALLIAVWLFGRATKPAPKRSHRPDVLDEGVAPAQRNQALIDSPAATAIVPATTVEPMGGLGEAIAVAANEPTENAEALAWEEKEVEEGAARSSETGDDIGKLKGIGPKLVAALHGMGVTRYAQIADWTEADVARVDAALPPAFQGRIARDNWIEQARLLSEGDVPGYEAKFGRL
jgi:predicted flap endonuclease-1-like 5' DNA nuclease